MHKRRNTPFVKVKFSKNLEFSVPKGTRLKYLIIKEKIDFFFPCAGEGICGRCKVKFLKGAPAPTSYEKRLLSPDEIDKGVRLACCATLYDDAQIEPLYEEYPYFKQTLLPLSIFPIKGDPLKDKDKAFALDLGTTTLSMSLLDISKKVRISLSEEINPNIQWGEDVISRVKAAIDGKEEELKSALLKKIISMAKELGLNNDFFFVASGNPVVSSILAGYPLDSLSKYPFEPAKKAGEWIEIDDLGPVYFMPFIGGFLGGDAASFILVLKLIKAKSLFFAVDLGTNAEVFLFTKDKIWAASAPAGSALEGVGISCGIGVKRGAILDVKRKDQKIEIKTQNGKAKGFCGSGLLSFVALLLNEGVIDPTGRIKPPDELGNYWRDKIRDNKVFLTSDIFVSQDDIRKIQLAKAAIQAAMYILAKKAKVSLSFIKSMYMAGRFGGYLSLDVLKTLNIAPAGIEKLSYLGNTSLLGAELVALSVENKGVLEELIHEVKVVQMIEDDEFQDIYIQKLNFE